MLPRRLLRVVPRPLAPPRDRTELRFRFSACSVVVLLFGVASPASAQPPTVPTSTPPATLSAGAPSAHPYAIHVSEAAQRFSIPEAWIWSVMRVESAGNPTATSHAGAMGLMQLMPGTYAELRSRYGLGPNPYDRRDNILAGAAYLREMHDRYGVAGMLAAYNAGPGRWEDYVSRGRLLPAETVAYMARLGTAVGGSAASSPTMVAQIDRFAWRRASLFVRAEEGRPDSDPEASPSQLPVTASASPDEPRNALTGNDPSAATEPADTLFAIRRPQ